MLILIRWCPCGILICTILTMTWGLYNPISHFSFKHLDLCIGSLTYIILTAGTLENICDPFLKPLKLVKVSFLEERIYWKYLVQSTEIVLSCTVRWDFVSPFTFYLPHVVLFFFLINLRKLLIHFSNLENWWRWVVSGKGQLWSTHWSINQTLYSPALSQWFSQGKDSFEVLCLINWTPYYTSLSDAL